MPTIYLCNFFTSAGFRADVIMASGNSSISACCCSELSKSDLFSISNFLLSSTPTSSSTPCTTSSCARKEGSEASTTYNNNDASCASARVEWNEATKSCGNFLIKPTVSDTSILGWVIGNKARTVVSRVAKSLFSPSTSLPVIDRINEDLPALV